MILKKFKLFSGYRIKDSSPKPDDLLLYQKMENVFDNSKIYLQKGLTLNDVALRCCSNKSYLSRAIHEAGGSTFSDEVNVRRVWSSIDYAREHPDVTVEQLSETFGFGSLVTMNKWFKKVAGNTPGAVLKELRRESR